MGDQQGKPVGETLSLVDPTDRFGNRRQDATMFEMWYLWVYVEQVVAEDSSSPKWLH
jgi:hypothetical protein